MVRYFAAAAIRATLHGKLLILPFLFPHVVWAAGAAALVKLTGRSGIGCGLA